MTIPARVHLGVPVVAAHLAVFYGTCLSNITPPVCVSAFAGAAIAGAPPMRTRFAALKYGTTLVLMPFTFVYVLEVLLEGSTFEIAYSSTLYALGCVLLAIAIQGAEPVGGRITILRRLVFGLAAAALMFPTTYWIDLTGLTLFALAAMPTLLFRRQSGTA